MVVDGEKLKELLRKARHEVVLCAPFIKESVLKVLLENIQEDVEVRVYTRWRAAEVAAGVSDLEVFDLVSGRENARLYIVDELHGKLYVADSECFLGSANLTGPALGWSRKNNLELMVYAATDKEEVKRFMEQLESGTPATFTMKEAIEKDAAQLVTSRLDEGLEPEGESTRWRTQWLPRCAAPEKLFLVYTDVATRSVAGGTLEDCSRDLRDLGVRPSLAEIEFEEEVRKALSSIPSFAMILDRIPGRIVDTEGRDLVLQCRPDLDAGDAMYLWQIVREWIGVFFRHEYEVAPESFVVRLRGAPKGT